MGVESDVGGDATATWWNVHADDLLRFATVLVGPHDAHDVVVESFLRCRPHLAQVEPRAQRAYLHRAVANQAKNSARERQRRWRRDLAAVGPAEEDQQDPQVDVRRAVASLSVMQRAVVFLVYWADMTEQQAADTLGISNGAVRQHVVRARSHLRRSLDG